MTARVIGPNIQWLKAVPLLILTGLLTILALGALTGAHSTQAPARNALFDFFQRLSPADHDPSENFHIIAIDEASLAKAGPWPWPRTVLAEIVETAAAAGAKAVILAEPMDTPDPLSPETIGEFWLEGASDDALAQQLARLPRTNQVLARSFSGVDGAIAVSLNALSSEINAAPLSRVSADTAPWLTFEGARAGFVALPIAIAQYPVDPDLMASAEPAIASLTPYPDGLIRSATILWSWNDAPTPSLALKAAFLALGETALTASADPTSAASEGSLIRTMQITDTALAIDPAQQFRLHLPKRIQTPATSAARFLGGAGSNRQVEGAVVIIGRASDLGPTLQTSRGPVSPAEMHSLIASQIAAGISLQRPQWTGYAEALATMLLGAAAIMFAQRLQFWQAAAFASALAILLIVGAFTAFASADLLLDPLPAAAALFVGALSVAGGRSLGGALRDDSVRGAFQDSLPNPALKDLASQGARAFDGVKRDITVLACELRFADEDIEALGDSPDEAVKVLAAACIDLRATIVSAGGAAEQAEGGRLYAYFNAPSDAADHIQSGCAAALRLIESMDKINADLDNSSRMRGVQLHLAIGVAVGECFAGAMGHGRNNRYSAFGPAVDRATFLRDQSPYYGPAVICDEAVHRQIHHHFAFLELDKIRMRSNERPFSVYALIGNPFIKSSKAFRALDESHREMLAAYRAGNVKKARTMLETAKSSPGARIALFEIYKDRLDALASGGVPDGWDGVQDAWG